MLQNLSSVYNRRELYAGEPSVLQGILEYIQKLAKIGLLAVDDFGLMPNASGLSVLLLSIFSVAFPVLFVFPYYHKPTFDFVIHAFIFRMVLKVL